MIATRAPGAHYRTIKAKPTRYRGTRMRSRLEVTAAKTLDRYGIAWSYEPHPDGRYAYSDNLRKGTGYLPDFRLWPRRRVRPWFVEVKPTAIYRRAPVEELHRALDRMNVIRTVHPDAVFVLWLVDSPDGIDGALLINHPGTGHWSAKPGTYLRTAGGRSTRTVTTPRWRDRWLRPGR